MCVCVCVCALQELCFSLRIKHDENTKLASTVQHNNETFAVSCVCGHFYDCDYHVFCFQKIW